MSEIAIDIDRVSRLFKRYRTPRHRILDLLGVRIPAASYDEFWALRDITLQVRRGERVALIGRNGAGKSTLLNIVCGQLQPSSGAVSVKGRIQALMELGTGFHPDFTGRENVLASLAYQGITGRRALASLDEIFDFAELEDFIEEPVKTYSAGMYARLAFATATAVEPDILIIDEVLGAGDAYFASKSTDRMRRLTMDTGATVLFVSHDLSSVQRLCDRAIWIERGRTHMEGSTLDVSKSYYASILEQEEKRLRARTSRAVARQRGTAADAPDDISHQFRLVAADGSRLRGRHPVRRIALASENGVLVEIRPGEPMDNDSTQSAYLLTDPTCMLWGKPAELDGEIVRCVEDTGGTYAHAPICFRLEGGASQHGLKIVIEHAANATDSLAIEVLEGETYRRLGVLQPAGGKWRLEQFATSVAPQAATDATGNPTSPAAETASPSAEFAAPSRDKWETDEARFLEIQPCNPLSSRPSFLFELGQDIGFRIVVSLKVPLRVLWLAAILYDDKGGRVAFVAEKIQHDLTPGNYEFLMILRNPNIRQGEYVVSFDLLPEFDRDWRGEGRLPYLCHWDRCVFFKVEESYRGVIDLGRVYLRAAVSHRPLNDGSQAASPAAPELAEH